MPSFDTDPERINLFDVGDRYLFTHYFERTDLFGALKEYYNGEEYRFEVPPDDLEDVRDALDERYYELVVITDLEPYCALKEQYTPHADILRNSVAHWSRDDYNFFIMKDPLAVREALEAGARPISETPPSRWPLKTPLFVFSQGANRKIATRCCQRRFIGQSRSNPP